MTTRLPRGIERLLTRLLPGDQREPIAGDLLEEYSASCRRLGTWRARLAVWWHALQLMASFTWERMRRDRTLPAIADEWRASAELVPQEYRKESVFIAATSQLDGSESAEARHEAPRRIRMLEALVQDVAFGLRLLRRQPGFTAVAIVTLALGIGANTAIFSIVDAVLWRPLPYPHADEIVSIAEQRPREGPLLGPVSPADFLDWRQDSQSFTAMAAYQPAMANLTGAGEPERLQALAVSPSFLTALGIAPARGRDFRTDEEVPGQHAKVLLTDALWRRRFAADEALVGRSISLGGVPYDVIGILPPGFWWPSRPDLLMPRQVGPDDRTTRSLHFLSVVARRRLGVSLEQAKAEMDVIGRRLTETYADSNTGHAPSVVVLREALVGNVRLALLVLLSAVGFVLLIACGNVATLLLARATGRQKEIAVRVALGAGRSRLVRQLLTESALLAAIGGGAGLLFADLSVRAFRAALPAQFSALPGIEHMGLDVRVLAVAAAVSLGTGFLFGLLPALTASQQHVSVTLNEEGRGGTSARGARVRAALVVAELALSLILLVGAALLLVSFKRLLDVPPGFQSQNIVAAEVTLPGSRYGTHPQVVAFFTALLQRVRAMPGVESAGAVTALPFSGAEARLAFQIEGRTGQSPIPVRAHPRLVSPDYLPTMRIPLVRGRHFTERDAEGAPDVIILNSAAVRRFWPDEDPIGRRVNFAFNEPRWLEIVGIVGDIKHQGLDADSNPEAYLPFLQTHFPNQTRNMTVVARATSDAAVLAPLLRAGARQIDKDQPLGAIRSMDELIARSMAPRRLNLLLLSGFALVAIALTAAGLYGVMAYLVAQRTHEIGVRMALGASRGSVFGLVLRQAGWMMLAGVALGVAGALALTRWLATLLFGVNAKDPAVYLTVSLLLAAVAFVAVVIPASRATRVDPLRALRQS